jgi:hypothetical protein
LLRRERNRAFSSPIVAGGLAVTGTFCASKVPVSSQLLTTASGTKPATLEIKLGH